MSFVRYNGVTIPYAFHTAFRQEVVYDDMGHTDWTCTKFDIEIQAVLNADYANMIYPALEGITDNAAVFMKAVRTALLQPRRQLQVTFNGVDLIPAATAGLGTVDVKNGPQPQHCTITQMTDLTFLLTYRIIAHYWENNSVNPLADTPPEIVTNATGNNILFNRWTETVDIDNANYTTRTREGKFVIRSDNPNDLIADEIRSQMAVVGVPAGFLREKSTYTVTPDGLAIQYRIVDQEAFKNPPFPAFEAEGHYSESSPMLGPLRFLEARVKLKGAKTTPQANLIATALAVAASKIAVNAGILNPFQPKRAVPMMMVIRSDMYKNEVECIYQAQVTVTQARTVGVAVNLAAMAFTPGSDPSVPAGPSAPQPAYLDRGSASLLLQAAAYYDPSLAATVIDKNTGQFNTLALEVGQAGVNQE